MALAHAQPFDVINVRPLAEQMRQTKSHSLLKTDKLQLMRVVLMAGQAMPEHHVAGEVTLQGLEGEVQVSTPGRSCTLAAGDVMALPPNASHALQAISDSSLLLTILLHQAPEQESQGGPG